MCRWQLNVAVAVVDLNSRDWRRVIFKVSPGHFNSLRLEWCDIRILRRPLAINDSLLDDVVDHSNRLPKPPMADEDGKPVGFQSWMDFSFPQLSGDVWQSDPFTYHCFHTSR